MFARMEIGRIAGITIYLDMMFVLVLKEVSVYLGRMNWVSQDLAIWLPIIVSGGLVAWFSERVLT